jgi:hypothetical protein
MIMDALEKDHDRDPGRRPDRHLPQAPPGRAPTPTPRNLLDSFYFNTKRYDLARVGRYKINQASSAWKPDINDRSLTVDDIVATIKYLVPCTPATRPSPASAMARTWSCASTWTTSTTSATVASARSAS